MQSKIILLEASIPTKILGLTPTMNYSHTFQNAFNWWNKIKLLLKWFRLLESQMSEPFPKKNPNSGFVPIFRCTFFLNGKSFCHLQFMIWSEVWDECDNFNESRISEFGCSVTVCQIVFEKFYNFQQIFIWLYISWIEKAKSDHYRSGCICYQLTLSSLLIKSNKSTESKVYITSEWS